MFRILEIGAGGFVLNHHVLDLLEAFEKSRPSAEEISAALGETSYAGKNAIPDLKKDPAYSTLSSTGKVDAEKELKTGGTIELEEEKRKKLAEKYQLDEETINEMASIKQLKSELEREKFKYTHEELIWAIQEAYGHGQDDEDYTVKDSIYAILKYLSQNEFVK
jgi:hypothetical protein